MEESGLPRLIWDQEATKVHTWVRIPPTIQKRDVMQLVATVPWKHDVGGSNPLIPTKHQSGNRRARTVWGFDYPTGDKI